METLKFKVGDKVRVKSLEWYNDNKNYDGNIYGLNNKKNFIKEMTCYCGQIFTIKEIENDYYIMHDNGFRWQDWMLEDEPVTEQLLKRNNMETKEMTKEEVSAYLSSTKILCTSKEESKNVQEKLFQFGIEWISKTKGICEDKYLLFINKKQELQHCSDIEYWMEDVNRRVEPSEILAIQIKEEKPKFDPKSLQDFDKVLVRGEDTNKWRLSFFDTYENGCFCCMDYCYKQCVPYNEETKYLKDTTDEAPEFYRI